MAITEAFTGTETVTTTEWSLATDSSYDTGDAQTGDGIYQVFIDLSAMQNGDVFTFRGYEKVLSGSTQRKFLEFDIAHAQTTPNWVSDSFILLHGWDFTITKSAGTDRSIDWSIRKIA